MYINLNQFHFFPGFSLSSAVCLFLGILSHLTSAGTDWAGLVSISLLTLVHYTGVHPVQWLVISDLAPVYHMVWAVSLASAVLWSCNLITVMLFPLALHVSC